MGGSGSCDVVIHFLLRNRKPFAVATKWAEPLRISSPPEVDELSLISPSLPEILESEDYIVEINDAFKLIDGKFLPPVHPPEEFSLPGEIETWVSACTNCLPISKSTLTLEEVQSNDQWPDRDKVLGRKGTSPDWLAKLLRALRAGRNVASLWLQIRSLLEWKIIQTITEGFCRHANEIYGENDINIQTLVMTAKTRRAKTCNELTMSTTLRESYTQDCHLFFAQRRLLLTTIRSIQQPPITIERICELTTPEGIRPYQKNIWRWCFAISRVLQNVPIEFTTERFKYHSSVIKNLCMAWRKDNPIRYSDCWEIINSTSSSTPRKRRGEFVVVCTPQDAASICLTRSRLYRDGGRSRKRKLSWISEGQQVDRQHLEFPRPVEETDKADFLTLFENALMVAAGAAATGNRQEEGELDKPDKRN